MGSLLLAETFEGSMQSAEMACCHSLGTGHTHEVVNLAESTEALFCEFPDDEAGDILATCHHPTVAKWEADIHAKADLDFEVHMVS